MPDTPSITIIKTIPYRGKAEEWSNTYHFTGTTPSTDAGWKTLADAIIAVEKACYPPSVLVVRVYGYEAGNQHAVGIIDYTAPPLTPVAGTLPTTNSFPIQAGDAAGWLRGKTTERGTNGKWKYTRKYFHGVAADSTGAMNPAQTTAYLALGAKLEDGTLPGSFKWSTPQGLLAGPLKVSDFATTRTLKRRGKRPSR